MELSFQVEEQLKRDINIRTFERLLAEYIL